MGAVSLTTTHMMPRLWPLGISPLVVACVISLTAIASLDVQAAEIHYAPIENLERIDVGLLGRARETIDIAGYIITDRPVIDALHAAKARGVAVRILLDHTQRHDLVRLGDLLDGARKKRRGPIMHLKSYVIDEHILRTGSANFTASGLKQQNNDLVIVEDVNAAKAFEAEFERVWDAGEVVQADISE
ncbi:MAG: phospholipase D-like domain-containing protein [Hyphomicrobiales bacterium]|nr:phospholipase D-like domain-containing protein [Hyphomicrobiales bacterium]